ncbi:MAG: hypothetical protein WBN75_13575, partial [Verrucomicrobiia bacterium]
ADHDAGMRRNPVFLQLRGWRFFPHQRSETLWFRPLAGNFLKAVAQFTKQESSLGSVGEEENGLLASATWSMCFEFSANRNDLTKFERTDPASRDCYKRFIKLSSGKIKV